jgi:ferrochelatase
MKWVGPSLGDTLEKIENKRVVIFPIAFTIDNLETVYELDIEYREVADACGFEEYIVAKCPNDSDEFSEFLAKTYKETK